MMQEWTETKAITSGIDRFLAGVETGEIRQGCAHSLKTPGKRLRPLTLLLVAELNGFPDVAPQSLAHCMQNMWLKSTALGLGFQLLSITAQMAEDKEFCDLLKIQSGEFALDGCLIGYPETLPPPVKRPKIDEISRWIE